MLRSVAFRKKREENWKKLENYLNRVSKRGFSSLSERELYDMVRLYREACSSLYVAKSISLDKHLHRYLENLVTRGFFIIYCTKPVGQTLSLKNFFVYFFPALVYKYRYYFFTALAVTLLGFCVAWWTYSPDSFYLFVPRGVAQGREPGTSKELLRRYLEGGREAPVSELTLFSASLFSHNTHMGILSFCLGIFLGIPTLYLLFYNGGMLGMMSHLHHQKGLALEWWAWVLPHGVTEFLAIFLCGTAGLLIGTALLQSGKERSLEALRQAGRDAGLLVVGSVFLFGMAALLEGFFRQSHASLAFRYLVVFSTFGFWLFYFGWLGRKCYEHKREWDVFCDNHNSGTSGDSPSLS